MVPSHRALETNLDDIVVLVRQFLSLVLHGVKEVGIKPLIEKAMGVQTLREDLADETEFVTISYWESIEAMSRFTGGDPTRIHHLDRDPEFLIELPSGVQILRILASHGNTAGDGPTD